MRNLIRYVGLLMLMSIGLVSPALADSNYRALLSTLGDYKVVEPLKPEESEFRYYYMFEHFPKGGPVLSKICPALLDEFAEVSQHIDKKMCEIYLAFTVNHLPDLDTIRAGQVFTLPAPSNENTIDIMLERRAEAEALNELADPYAVARTIIELQQVLNEVKSDVSNLDIDDRIATALRTFGEETEAANRQALESMRAELAVQLQELKNNTVTNEAFEAQVGALDALTDRVRAIEGRYDGLCEKMGSITNLDIQKLAAQLDATCEGS